MQKWTLWFLSFKAASYFVYEKHAHALLTLPIHKKLGKMQDLNTKDTPML